MKQQGRCVIGDPISVDNYTSGWPSVRLHPTTFYRHMAEFQKGLDKTAGYYAEIDMGQFILIKFSDKSDVTAFYKKYHEHI